MEKSTPEIKNTNAVKNVKENMDKHFDPTATKVPVRKKRKVGKSAFAIESSNANSVKTQEMPKRKPTISAHSAHPVNRSKTENQNNANNSFALSDSVKGNTDSSEANEPKEYRPKRGSTSSRSASPTENSINSFSNTEYEPNFIPFEIDDSSVADSDFDDNYSFEADEHVGMVDSDNSMDEFTENEDSNNSLNENVYMELSDEERNAYGISGPNDTNRDSNDYNETFDYSNNEYEENYEHEDISSGSDDCQYEYNEPSYNENVDGFQAPEWMDEDSSSEKTNTVPFAACPKEETNLESKDNTPVEPTQEEKTKKKKGKKKHRKAKAFLISLICLILVLLCGGAALMHFAPDSVISRNIGTMTMRFANAETSAKEINAENEFANCTQYDVSTQTRVGDAIPAGEYFVMPKNDRSFVEVASDNSGSINSIIYNDNITTFTFVTLSEGEYFRAVDAYVVSADNAKLPAVQNNEYGNGTYRVGTDIPEGTYEFTPSNDSNMTITIATDSSWNTESILSSEDTNENREYSLVNGQYVTVSNGTIHAK